MTSGPKSRVNKTSSTLKLKWIIKTHDVSFHEGYIMKSNITNKNKCFKYKMQETKMSSISTEDREGQKCSFDFWPFWLLPLQILFVGQKIKIV